MTRVKLGFALAFCAGALSVFGVAALQSESGVSTWTGKGADAKWSTAGNWDVKPTATSRVRFPDGCVASVLATLTNSRDGDAGVSCTVGANATEIGAWMR